MRAGLVLSGSGLLLAAGLGIAAGPASATPVTFTGVVCTAHVTGAITLDTTVNEDFTVEMTSPTEADAGTDVTITIPGRETALPASAQGIPIANYTDLSNAYVIVGGTVVGGSIQTNGTPKNNGTTIAASATISGNTVTFSAAGPLDPGTLDTPDVTFKVHAGAAGSTITGHAGNVNLTAHLSGIAAQAATTCALPTDTLTTTQVVAPPPPGAPDAVADTATTQQDNAVTIDVLKNDVPNVQNPIDQASEHVTSNPSHGKATVNANGTITYTPNSGFHGTDAFDYQICSQVPQVAARTFAAEASCDTATVTVTVTAPPSTTTSTAAPVTTQGNTTPSSTVAPAELPRTGSNSTMPLAFTGAALLGLGLAATHGARRRRI